MFKNATSATRARQIQKLYLWLCPFNYTCKRLAVTGKSSRNIQLCRFNKLLYQWPIELSCFPKLTLFLFHIKVGQTQNNYIFFFCTRSDNIWNELGCDHGWYCAHVSHSLLNLCHFQFNIWQAICYDIALVQHRLAAFHRYTLPKVGGGLPVRFIRSRTKFPPLWIMSMASVCVMESVERLLISRIWSPTWRLLHSLWLNYCLKICF